MDRVGEPTRHRNHHSHSAGVLARPLRRSCRSGEPQPTRSGRDLRQIQPAASEHRCLPNGSYRDIPRDADSDAGTASATDCTEAHLGSELHIDKGAGRLIPPFQLAAGPCIRTGPGLYIAGKSSVIRVPAARPGDVGVLVSSPSEVTASCPLADQMTPLLRRSRLRRGVRGGARPLWGERHENLSVVFQPDYRVRLHDHQQLPSGRTKPILENHRPDSITRTRSAASFTRLLPNPARRHTHLQRVAFGLLVDRSEGGRC